MNLRRIVVWLVIAIVAITFVLYWRTIIFVCMVLLYPLGIGYLASIKEDVDGRDKPGHDGLDLWRIPIMP